MPEPTDEFVLKPFLYQWPVDAAIFAAENWDKWYEVTNVPYAYETPEFEDRLPDGWQKFEVQIARKDFPHGLQFSKTNPMPRPKKWHYYYANRVWCPPKRGVYG